MNGIKTEEKKNVLAKIGDKFHGFCAEHKTVTNCVAGGATFIGGYLLGVATSDAAKSVIRGIAGLFAETADVPFVEDIVE